MNPASAAPRANQWNATSKKRPATGQWTTTKYLPGPRTHINNRAANFSPLTTSELVEPSAIDLTGIPDVPLDKLARPKQIKSVMAAESWPPPILAGVALLIKIAWNRGSLNRERVLPFRLVAEHRQIQN